MIDERMKIENRIEKTKCPRCGLLGTMTMFDYADSKTFKLDCSKCSYSTPHYISAELAFARVDNGQQIGETSFSKEPIASIAARGLAKEMDSKTSSTHEDHIASLKEEIHFLRGLVDYLKTFK